MYCNGHHCFWWTLCLFFEYKGPSNPTRVHELNLLCTRGVARPARYVEFLKLIIEVRFFADTTLFSTFTTRNFKLFKNSNFFVARILCIFLTVKNYCIVSKSAQSGLEKSWISKFCDFRSRKCWVFLFFQTLVPKFPNFSQNVQNSISNFMNFQILV